MLINPIEPERYYYAELCSDSTSIMAYTNLSYREFLRVITSYRKTVEKHDNNHTIIFGNMKNLKQLGQLGKRIIKQSRPYQADTMYLVNNTTAWYLEHGEDE